MSRRPAGLAVRVERAGDAGEAAAIQAVHLAAFPSSAEADLVEAIRASAAFVPQLSIVASLDEAIVGHILLSYVTLDTGGGAEEVLELAPMAVTPEHQGEGIGSALVVAGLDAAEIREEPLVLVLGHPWFYPRFGFRPSTAYGIVPPRPVPEATFMVKPLTTYRSALRGRVILPPVFEGV
ncbi:MAG TPA: N-acetyltransferase [Candidatus Limnocylindrales bacterium]|nr:N-acetyltransferase [Candidatus Limnocylindrales bacterium]